MIIAADNISLLARFHERVNRVGNISLRYFLFQFSSISTGQGL